MWNCGIIDIPYQNGTRPAYYTVKHYDNGSIYGINEGKISKLSIEINKEIKANYDRGWDIEPDKTNKGLMTVYNYLIERYN